jgi:hypothetical protein
MQHPSGRPPSLDHEAAGRALRRVGRRHLTLRGSPCRRGEWETRPATRRSERGVGKCFGRRAASGTRARRANSSRSRVPPRRSPRSERCSCRGGTCGSLSSPGAAPHSPGPPLRRSCLSHRPERLRRIVQQVEEANLTRGPIQARVSFDPVSFTVAIGYAGQLLPLPTGPLPSGTRPKRARSWKASPTSWPKSTPPAGASSSATAAASWSSTLRHSPRRTDALRAGVVRGRVGGSRLVMNWYLAVVPSPPGSTARG